MNSFSVHFLFLLSLHLHSGIHGLPGLETGQSELGRDFQNLVDLESGPRFSILDRPVLVSGSLPSSISSSVEIDLLRDARLSRFRFFRFSRVSEVDFRGVEIAELELEAC